MYHVQPEEVKRQIISAVADLKTDKALGFLYNAYDEADNWGTKRIILKALYEYSSISLGSISLYFSFPKVLIASPRISVERALICLARMGEYFGRREC